jgi:cephalosporin hydroxylase
MTRGVVSVDLAAGTVTLSLDGAETTHPLGSAEGFEVVSRAWLRAGWDAKYVYGFTWAGRPIIQLPEDLVRVQEVVHAVRPRVIVETGIAHGGSLIFYAGLLKQMEGGLVVGVDIEIRAHNRAAIEAHELFGLIRLVEGSSVDPAIVDRVRAEVAGAEPVMVILDSNHTREHVLAELRSYAPLVSPGSFLVVADGIMRDLAGAPRTRTDWVTDNPQTAVDEFLAENADFQLEEPAFPFNEGAVAHRVTYWPRCYLRRKS